MAYRHLPARVSDQRVFVADICKISLACDWRPKISATVGVKEMLNWIELL
jgi:CDP-paratose 2-epimerase